MPLSARGDIVQCKRRNSMPRLFRFKMPESNEGIRVVKRILNKLTVGSAQKKINKISRTPNIKNADLKDIDTLIGTNTEIKRDELFLTGISPLSKHLGRSSKERYLMKERIPDFKITLTDSKVGGTPLIKELNSDPMDCPMCQSYKQEINVLKQINDVQYKEMANLKEKLIDIQRLSQIQNCFKTEEILRDIDETRIGDKNEKTRVIMLYQQAIKLLQYYKGENKQQGAFISIISNIKQLEEENTYLRSKLVDFKKYIQTQKNTYKTKQTVSDICLTKLWYLL